MRYTVVDDFTFKKNILKIRFCGECSYFQVPDKKRFRLAGNWGWCSLRNVWVQDKYTQCDEVREDG